VAAAWDWIKDKISAAWDGIKSVFFNYTLPGLIYKNWDAIRVGITEAWDRITGTIREKWNDIVSNVKSLGVQFKEAGAAIIDSILSGINEKWDALKSKISSVTDYLPAFMKPDSGSAAGSGFAGLFDGGGSIPSGQFGIVGENGPEIVTGPAQVTGRQRTAAIAASAALALGLAATPATARPLHPMSLPVSGGATVNAVGAGSSPTPVVNIHAPITVVQQPGQSAQDVAAEVMRLLEAKERQAQARARSSYRDRGGFE
jgi:phage-related tail protein